MKFLKFLFWVLYLILLIPVVIYIPVLAVPLVLLAVFILVIIWAKNRRKKRMIPNEVMQDFEEAERLYHEYPDVQPHRILWKIAKSKSERRDENGKRNHERTTSTSAGTGIPELPELPSRREDVSSLDDTGTAEHKDSGAESRSGDRKGRGLFRRRREKT
jgi:hypothetical protein